MKKKLIALSAVILIGGSVLGVSRAHSHSYTPASIKAVSDTSTLSTTPTTQPAVDTQTTQVAPTATPPPAPPASTPPPAPTCTAEQQNELNVAKSNLDALKAYATAHGFITYRQSDQDVLNNKINDGLAEGCVLN